MFKALSRQHRLLGSKLILLFTSIPISMRLSHKRMKGWRNGQIEHEERKLGIGRDNEESKVPCRISKKGG